MRAPSVPSVVAALTFAAFASPSLAHAYGGEGRSPVRTLPTASGEAPLHHRAVRYVTRPLRQLRAAILRHPARRAEPRTTRDRIIRHATNALARTPLARVGRARNLLRGIVVDGPHHTVAAIRRRPLAFGGMVAATAAAGGLARAYGVDPSRAALAASALVYGYQLRLGIPQVAATTGSTRWREAGAQVVWPGLLVGVTAVGGHALSGHDPAPAATHAVTRVASTAEIARASAQTVVIAGDAPTVAITALDSRSGAPTSGDAREPAGH